MSQLKEREFARNDKANMSLLVGLEPELSQNLFAIKLYSLICLRHEFGWIASYKEVQEEMAYKQGNKILYPDRTTIRRAAIQLSERGFIIIRPFDKKTWFYPCLDIHDMTKAEYGGINEEDIAFYQQKALESQQETEKLYNFVQTMKKERANINF